MGCGGGDFVGSYGNGFYRVCAGVRTNKVVSGDCDY